MVFAIRNSADYRTLADWLESAQSASPTTGDYHNWPEQWAIDSVQQARRAYQNVEVDVATIDRQHLRITVQLPSRYIETSRAIAAEQLAKAGFRLANLLNTIQWQ